MGSEKISIDKKNLKGRYRTSFMSFLSRFADPITTVSFVIGIIVWMTTFYINSTKNTESIEELKDQFSNSRKNSFRKYHQLNNKLQDNSGRLSRIEGKLDIIIENLKK